MVRRWVTWHYQLWLQLESSTLQLQLNIVYVADPIHDLEFRAEETGLKFELPDFLGAGVANSQSKATNFDCYMDWLPLPAVLWQLKEFPILSNFVGGITTVYEIESGMAGMHRMYGGIECDSENEKDAG